MGSSRLHAWASDGSPPRPAPTLALGEVMLQLWDRVKPMLESYVGRSPTLLHATNVAEIQRNGGQLQPEVRSK
ncbi:hypothetical protein ACJ72_03656 [Emergomyces africanus]|uniref:Uncharacterized protein n=1 Tax=Emergomyces africanus TaxID=1955775 RepID=A0A1B7NYZ9_9EURO|nr:hypothetical protein ACJ72_03656 [Emergomyces africanus]